MNFGSQTALSMAALRSLAPSAFATEPHESRSTRFGFVPTVRVIERMMSEGFVPVSASQSTARDMSKQAYTKHMIRFRHQAEMERQAVVGDSIREIVAVNAHDGSNVYEIYAGLFRYVCGNGMIVADRTVGSIRVPHRGNIADQVVQASYQIIDRSSKVIEKSKQWGSISLSNGEQQAFAQAAHKIRFEPVMRLVDGVEVQVPHAIHPNELLQPRRYDDKGDSLWHVFNRVQENVIRGGLTGRHVPQPGSRQVGRQITTREVKGIAQNIDINQKLWDNAELMAELKLAAA
jgi:hypothetical protein